MQVRVLSLLAIAAWLLIGALASVLTAWGSYWIPWGQEVRNTEPDGARASDEHVAWPHAVPQGWPVAAKHRGRYASVWLDIVDFAAGGVQPRTPEPMFGGHLPMGIVYEEWAGVPFRGLYSWEVRENHMSSDPTWREPHGALFLRPLPANEMGLPFIPLWPGFALNTLFYAVIAYGLWQIPLAIRRRRRRRANKCVKCGYDLKGLAAGAPCPECGRAV